MLKIPCFGEIILDGDVEVTIQHLKVGNVFKGKEPFRFVDKRVRMPLSQLYPSPSDRKMAVEEVVVYIPPGGPRRRDGSVEKFCAKTDGMVQRAQAVPVVSGILGREGQAKLEVIPSHPVDVEDEGDFLVITFIGNVKEQNIVGTGHLRYEVEFNDGFVTEGTTLYSPQGQGRFFVQARVPRRREEKIVGIRVIDATEPPIGGPMPA